MNSEILSIETKRLILRPIALSDVDGMHAYASLPEVARYMLWEPLSRDETEARIAKWLTNLGDTLVGANLPYAVTLKPTGEMIGDCGMMFRDDEARQGEIGYSFHPQFQGQGFATEAVTEILRLGFERCNRHRIFARCDARNIASWKLMERLGMRREAHFREHAVFKGGWDEEYYYAMLEDEWRARQDSE